MAKLSTHRYRHKWVELYIYIYIQKVILRERHGSCNSMKASSAGSPTAGGYLSSPMSATGPHAPVMLVGNKSDRVTEREVSTQEGGALAKEMGCDFVEASAKQCIIAGLKEGK